MRIAQITDIHMTAGPPPAGGYDAVAALDAVLARVADLAPDLVLLSGDMAANGLAAEYARLAERLAGFPAPMLAVPGNHDVRAAFAAGLPGVTIGTGESLNLAHEDGPVRIFGLDTLAPDNDPSGIIGEAQLGWLAGRLEVSDPRPVFVFLHHPPFRLGLPLDDTRCYDGDDLGAVVLGHPRVLGVTCGHVHRTARVAWAGTSGGVCPSVAWQLPLDLREDEVPRLVPQAPAFQLHVLHPELGLVTHTEFVSGGGAGPAVGRGADGERA